MGDTMLVTIVQHTGLFGLASGSGESLDWSDAANPTLNIPNPINDSLVMLSQKSARFEISTTSLLAVRRRCRSVCVSPGQTSRSCPDNPNLDGRKWLVTATGHGPTSSLLAELLVLAGVGAAVDAALGTRFLQH